MEHVKRVALLMKAEFHSVMTEMLLLFFSQLAVRFFIVSPLSSLASGLKLI